MTRLSIVCFSIFFSFAAAGQDFMSFYQLRDIVPQTSNLQPAFIPQNSFSFALPSVGTIIQGDFKLQEILYKRPGGNEYSVNLDILNGVALPKNTLSVEANINVFNFGIKTKKGGISLFSNIKSNFDFVYSKDLIEFLANGNSNRIGETIDFSESAVRLDAYHEVGLGYARKFLSDKLTLGLRVKLVNGMYHVSMDESAHFSLSTNADDFSWQYNVQDATINTAGLDYLFDAENQSQSDWVQYMILNQNHTVAYDFGFSYQPLKWLEVEAAVNDLGKITWREQVRNYNTEDTNFTFSGIDLRGSEDIGQAFQDSLVNKFKSNETELTFSSVLPKRVYLSASFFVSPNNRFSFTYFKRDALADLRASYAISYNHQFEKFVIGVLGSYRGANSEINWGANVATNIGPMQFYLAMDNALVTNKPERYSKADFRFGINLMFGYKKWRSKSELVDLEDL